MTASELLEQFPLIPDPADYASPEAYLVDAMTAARWFIDHAGDIRSALEDASIEWIGSADALDIAKSHGIKVTSAGLRKAAVTNGYIRHKQTIVGRHLYDRASVKAWATTRKYHKAGPRTEYGSEI